MTESVNQNPFASFEAYDPVRVLVCEDCCSKIAGCSHSFDEVFEWGRLALEVLIVFAKYLGVFLFSIQMFFLWLFPKEDTDPQEDAYKRQKRADLALIADRKAQIRKDHFYDIRIYDQEPLAKQHHLQDVANRLLSSLGEPNVDPGLVDIELRKVRSEQIALAEQQYDLTAVQVSNEIQTYKSELSALDHDWRTYKRREEHAPNQWESDYWKDRRLRAQNDIKQTERDLREAQNHFAIIG